ncbi:MAG: response regulator [bacterium]
MQRGAPGVPAAFRVLIVDDQAHVCSAIASLLVTRGYDAVTAESGAEALVRIRAEYFDVMLCDVCMPEMSGLELLSEALLLAPSLATVMLTALNDLDTAHDALARGALDFLTKPVELEDLDRVVGAAALHGRRVAQRRAAQEAAAGATGHVELRGGPHGGRAIRVEDRVDDHDRLWVVRGPDGLHTLASVTEPGELAARSRVLGCYRWSPIQQAMLWEPRDG